MKKKKKVKVLYKKAENKILKDLKKFNLLGHNGIIEFPQLGLKELDKIIKVIKKFKGGILLIDYGFVGKKSMNTLQSVKDHKKNKLFDSVGNADITSLVNFNLLQKYFYNKKLNTSDIVSQSYFLKKIGILQRAEILSRKLNFSSKANLYFRLKRLLDDRYMGELFKVIFAQKTKKNFLLGFQ